MEFLHGDVRNPEDLEALPEHDLLLECSAEPSVLAGYGQAPAYVVQTNLSGTLNCLESVRRTKAAIVFLSTSRVYPMEILKQIRLDDAGTRFELSPEQNSAGLSMEGVSEDFPINGLRTLYGATKLTSELILLEYLAMYGLRGVINRCGIVTGPWQMGKVEQGVIALWVARHVFGEDLAYFGYGGLGKQVRDFLHVEDLYNLLCLQVNDLQPHSGRVYNVGGGRERSFSLQELTVVCQEVTGNKVSIRSVAEDREADIPWYISDSRRVKESTGWEPKRYLKETVAEIAHWIESNRDLVKPVLGKEGR